jgi:tetratricopeptide (TPR) repeat protein
MHTLSLNEAALLARELPNLGRLLHGDSPVGLERGRELVARTLAAVQGHPKLIELAEGQASDPEALAQQLEKAEAEWAGGEGELAAFFEAGESQFKAEDFLKALAGWSRDVSATLPPAARTLFHFLCALEEEDRWSRVLEANWADLWQRLERPGEAPDLAATLAPLLAAGLVEARPVEGAGVRYTLHPGVAEAGRAEAEDAFQAAVDAELAAFWITVALHGQEEEMRGGGALIRQAGQSAAPYLLRQQRWAEASTLLEGVIIRDSSPETVAAVLPLLRRIAIATEGTERGLVDAGSLAKTLRMAGRFSEAKTILRDLMRTAAGQEQFRTASSAAGDLINLLQSTGWVEEALTLVEEKKDYTRRAGLGPWTQLSGEGQRLQLLTALGHYEEVLSTVEALQEQMRALPEESEQEETVEPWNVREVILDVGSSAARRLERSEAALALNTERVASAEARSAPALEIARKRFINYGPLLSLDRFREARALLYECRVVFEQERAVRELGLVFSALADLEYQLSHHQQAITFEETALRYTYLAGTPEDCAGSHHNLSQYLERAGRERQVALAHRLAAGVIRFQIDSGRLVDTLQNLAIDLANSTPDLLPLPASFDELCRLVEGVDGARFRELFERLPRRAAMGDAALAEVLRMAQQHHTSAEGPQ